MRLCFYVWLALFAKGSQSVDSDSSTLRVCSKGYFLSSFSNACVLCPGGYYGSMPGLTKPNCSGECSQGYFCPPGSTSARERECGGTKYYCPKGSPVPLAVLDGFYTVQNTLAEGEGLDHVTSSVGRTRYNQTKCEAGHYCIRGIRRECPSGSYGNSKGLTTKRCTSLCPEGHYCPKGTSYPIECPAGFYGSHRGLHTPECEAECPVGSYCEIGSVIPKPCPMGLFGGEKKLSSRSCSSKCINSTTCTDSLCPEGYYCPLGTISPSPCGSTDKLCPLGSAEPSIAQDGFYTISTINYTPKDYILNLFPNVTEINDSSLYYINQTTRIHEVRCEPGSYCKGGVKRLCDKGHYGDTSMISVSTCSGKCPAGYYCPAGTTNYRLHPCGNSSFFCPEGSWLPSLVAKGYYTTGGVSSLTRQSQMVCEPGFYCKFGIRHPCSAGTYGATQGLSFETCSGRCSDGHICSLNSVSATQSSCSAGFYSTNGVRCLPCAPGFYCNTGSGSYKQNKCGHEGVFCPLQTAIPITVADGFYSVGGDDHTRSSQRQCKQSNAFHLPQCPSSIHGSG